MIPPDQIPLFILPERTLDEMALPSLKLVAIGHFSQKYSTVNRTFGLPAIAFVLNGKGFFKWTEQKDAINVESPFYYYVQPGTTMCYGPEPSTWWEERYITFTGPRTVEWQSLGWLPTANQVYPLANPEQLAQIHQQIMEGFLTHDPRRIAEAKLEIERLVFRFHILTQSLHDNSTSENRLVNLVKSWGECPEKPIDMKKAASSVALSYSRFGQLFLDKFHLTPYQYLLWLRLKKAEYWLSSSSYSIKEIAFMTGFRSLKSFDRAFLKKNGETPTRFRSEMMTYLLSGHGAQPG